MSGAGSATQQACSAVCRTASWLSLRNKEFVSISRATRGDEQGLYKCTARQRNNTRCSADGNIPVSLSSAHDCLQEFHVSHMHARLENGYRDSPQEWLACNKMAPASKAVS